MQIRSGDNRVQIAVAERIPPELPRAGDLKLTVHVLSQGFTGCGSAWVAADAFTVFLKELTQLEIRREGVARLESMSPGEFMIELRPIDGWGHIAIFGLLSKLCYVDAGPPQRNGIHFAFGLNPTLVPWFVAQFRALLKDPIMPD